MKKFSHISYATNGYYLIDAHFPSCCVDLRVWGVIQFGDDELCIPLPASFRGRVFELIPRPVMYHQLSIKAESSNGPQDAKILSIDVVSGWSAHYWMWHRIVGMASYIKRLRISWWQVLTETFDTYRALGALRYHFPAPEYSAWKAQFWSFTPDIQQRLNRYLQKQYPDDLIITALIDSRQPASVRDLHSSQIQEKTLTSVKRQAGLRVVSSVLDAIENEPDMTSCSDWLLYMQPGHQLEPWALAWMLTEARSHPDATLIYSDHARLTESGHPCDPCFKPDWSLELQRVSHYVGNCFLIRASMLTDIQDTLGYFPSAYELVLEVGMRSAESQIRHISAVLWHKTVSLQHEIKDVCVAVDPEQLQTHLQRHKIAARVVHDQRGQVRICYDLPAIAPKVSIIIPTRDMLHFLQPCVDSILRKTRWPNYEILILNNQSSCAKTLAYMQQVTQDDRVKVWDYDHPFNFSAINNFAVSQSDGDLICLLNNDTEVISPDWLDEMASRLLQPEVGAVGARLYFRDGRVQHAGDVLGPGGCANHLHGILEADDPGYMSRAILPQELSAVTAACLLTYKSLYQQIGGLDETNLTVAFNDVDFCLRIREAGYSVIYTPYAELYHYESVSRGKDDNPEKQARAKREVEYMKSRWGTVIERDPFYNPNLNYAKPDFTLGRYPRIDWPW